MVFGAFCIHDYGFDYGDVRAHGGLAYFPEIAEGSVRFAKNPTYAAEKVVVKLNHKTGEKATQRTSSRIEES